MMNQKPVLIEYKFDFKLNIMVDVGYNDEEPLYRIDSIHIIGENITRLFNTVEYFCEDELHLHIKNVFKQLNGDE